MYRSYLPKALALVVFTTGLSLAGAQQPAPDGGQTAPQTAPMHHHHRHPKDPAREARFLGKKLNLSDDQTARLEPILAGREQKLEALRSNQQLSPEDRHQQMRAIHRDTRQQMASVLSPEQVEQFRQMRRAHHGEHGRQNPSAAPAPTA